MRYALLVLLVILHPITLKAQKHNGFVDVSIPGISPFGASATYNYKLKKHFGIGGGVQIFNYHPVTRQTQLIPAIFADLRFYHTPGRKHQFFSMIDLGASIFEANSGYNRDKTIYYSFEASSFYLGLGFEYLYSITKRGSGPYAALKILSNTFIVDGYYYPSKKPVDLLAFDAVPAICVGFKF